MAPERVPGTSRATRGLDLLNFFIADVQTGFGPFVAVYLTARHWTQVEIGFALSLGTITAMVSQVPAGVLVDAMRGKREAVAAGIVAVGLSALLLAAWPVLLPVLVAQVLHGFASCV
jgi:MFS family permease